MTHAADCTCTEHPLPDSMLVRDARDAYLAENGFTVEAYDAPRTEASVFGLRFAVPNTPTHRWAIMLHDLHHVATGFGTDLAGEGEVSVWEAQRGLRPLGAYVGTIVVGGALTGLLIAPRRALRAFRMPGARKALFATHDDYDALLGLTVGALRDKLGLPRDGLVGARRLHGFAPATAPLAATR